MVLLSGRNGAGKSSVGEALVWVLYGETTDGRRADAVRRWGSKGACSVTLELEINGSLVNVTRGRGPNFLNLFIDGEQRNGATTKETQSKLLSLVGLDVHSFKSVVFSPQGSSTFLERTDAERKEILDQILGTERFKRAQEKVRKISAECFEVVSEIEHSVSSTEKVVEALEESKQSLHEQKQAWEDKRSTQLRELRQRLLPASEKRELEALVEASESALRDAEESNARLSDALDHYSSLEAAVEQAKRELEACVEPAAPKEPGTTCGECGQEYLDRGEIIAKYVQEMKKWGDELDAARARRETLEDHYVTVVEALAREEKPQFISTADIKNKAGAAHYKIRNDNDLLQKMKELEAADYPIQDALENLDRQIDEQKLLIDKNLLLLSQERQKLESLSFWDRAFGPAGVKSLLFSEALPYINERASIYLSALSEAPVNISISSQSTTKSGTIQEKIDITVSYGNTPPDLKSKSGGETKRINLAILLALGDLARMYSQSRINMRFFDEPFENLDPEGTQRVSALLKEIDVDTCFVVSHNADLQQEFEQVVRM